MSATPPHHLSATPRRLVVGWDTIAEHPGALAYHECRTATVAYTLTPLTDTPASRRQATMLLLVEVLREERAALIADHLQQSILPLLLLDDQTLGLSLAELAMRGVAERFPQASASLACIAPQRSAIAFCGGNRHALIQNGTPGVLRSGDDGTSGVIPVDLAIGDWLFILARSTKNVIPSGTSLTLAQQTGSVKAACQALMRQASQADHFSHHAAMGAHLQALADQATAPTSHETEASTPAETHDSPAPPSTKPSVRRNQPRRSSLRH